MSDAILSQGFKIEVRLAEGVSPDALVEIGSITSFSGFDGVAAEIDETDLQDEAKEFNMGLQDYGNFSIDVNYLPDDDGQNLLRAAKSTQDLVRFMMSLSDASYVIFNGYVLSNSLSGGVDSKLDGQFNIRITGDVTFLNQDDLVTYMGEVITYLGEPIYYAP